MIAENPACVDEQNGPFRDAMFEMRTRLGLAGQHQHGHRKKFQQEKKTTLYAEDCKDDMTLDALKTLARGI